MHPADLTETERTDLEQLAVTTALRDGAGPNASLVAEAVMARFDDPRPFRDLDHARTWIRVATKQAVLDHPAIADRGLVAT